MENQPALNSKKQFEKSFAISNVLLLLSGIKLSRNPWNKFIDHFVNYQLIYYNFIILHSVIVGEIYHVIDCIETGKSLVELSFNLPCITVCVLATTKLIFLYVNKNILIDLFYKLKEVHTTNDRIGIENDEIDNENDKKINENEEIITKTNKIVQDSVKLLKFVSLLMVSISVIVQITFCSIPGVLMVYIYYHTGELVIIYPYLVKYHFFDAYAAWWWPLEYTHQILATIVACTKYFGTDILFFGLCSYIEMHFRLLSLQFENKQFVSKFQTKKNLAKAVRRHQELIHLVNQLESLFSKSNLFHMVSASFLICLSAFIITITDKLNVQFQYFTFLIMALSQISLVCYFADLLMRSSSQVTEAVYKCSWYEVDEDAKKIILLIMIRSQKACKLTAWSFVDLNLGAFTRILSTSWSYFALLRTMYK